MAKKVLIITHSNDNKSVQKVADFIEQAGGEVIRFDVDKYPLQYALSTVFINNRWRILLENEAASHDLDDVTAVWYRRSFNIGAGLQQELEKEYLPATLTEIKRTLYGMLEGLPCFHLHRFSTHRRLDSKEEQLRVAQQHGLAVPATCISNDPAQVERFMQQLGGTVVAKMQSSFAIYRNEHEHVVFTNLINSSQLQEIEAVQYCPMIFQQRIEKKLELRVTIVGREIFAFSIDSQQLESAQVDWRKEGVKLIKDWQPYTLPAYLQQQLLAFMDSYKLNYGAIDLILTPDDQYYFLEINVAGEYFWLDALCNYAISHQLAAVLTGDAARCG